MRHSPKQPLVLGHRGYRSLAPGTPPAFRAALEHGADGVEFDVQKEPSGAYVVIHDPPKGDGAAPKLRDVLAGFVRHLPRRRAEGGDADPGRLPPGPRRAHGLRRHRRLADLLVRARLLPPWKAWGIDGAPPGAKPRASASDASSA